MENLHCANGVIVISGRAETIEQAETVLEELGTAFRQGRKFLIIIHPPGLTDEERNYILHYHISPN